MESKAIIHPHVRYQVSLSLLTSSRDIVRSNDNALNIRVERKHTAHRVVVGRGGRSRAYAEDSESSAEGHNGGKLEIERNESISDIPALRSCQRQRAAIDT